MRTILLFTLLLQGFCAWGQDFDKKENQFLGYIYQQPGYLLNDPKGDILLLWTARNLTESITAYFKGNVEEVFNKRAEKVEELLKIYPEYRPREEFLNIVVNDYQTIRIEDDAIRLEGHQAPFKVKNLSLMLKQVISEEFRNGLVPSLGEIHEWSPEIKSKLKRKFIVFSRFSKLLIALSRGVTSNFLVTGREEELAKYILSRDINSIGLEEMFRLSYRINKGDVYLSLLTIENVLSKYWLDKNRSKRAITTRLKDITNYNYSTDKFGSWYHLFGIMLYGYAHGALASTAVGNIETMGSQIMTGFDDERQESFINSRGGRVGARINKFVKKKAYENFELNDKYKEEEFYLNLNEDFTKRLKKKNPA